MGIDRDYDSLRDEGGYVSLEHHNTTVAQLQADLDIARQIAKEKADALASERARIVEWLREQATARSWGSIRVPPEAKIAEQIASAIERGDHL